jgi:lipopolysaccharide export system protein LptA
MISTAHSNRVRNRKLMRVLLIVSMLVGAAPMALQAKQTDRNQPVQVSAKSADALAKPNGVSHLKGDVVITQGTLKATGASATIHFDANSEVNRVVLVGAPAHLRQVDDNGNLIKGHADRIDYNVANGIATLTGQAFVNQTGRGSARGDKLVYNTETSQMTANSKGDKRVHLTFKPRQASSTSKPAPASSAGKTSPASSTGDLSPASSNGKPTPASSTDKPSSPSYRRRPRPAPAASSGDY